MKFRGGFQDPATDFHCDLYESNSHPYTCFSKKHV